MEAPPGFEPGVRDLQSHALPLGYGARASLLPSCLRSSLFGRFLRHCALAPCFAKNYRFFARKRGDGGCGNWGPRKAAGFVGRRKNVRESSGKKPRTAAFGALSAHSDVWSGQRDSNSLPPPWQGGALPDELWPHLHFLERKVNKENFRSNPVYKIFREKTPAGDYT